MGLWNMMFGPPSMARFSRLYMKALRQAGDTREMRYDSSKFCIQFTAEGKSSGVANLANAYADYSQAPTSLRANCLSSYVRATLSYLKDMPADFEEAKPDLRPKLWSRATIERVRLEALLTGEKPLDLPGIEIGSHLSLVLVYDLPESTRSISQDELDKWGVTFYEAMEVAKRNLADNPPVAVASIGDLAFSVMGGDSYDATRLANVDFIRNHVAEGDVWAMAPSRDNLYFTGADDHKGMEIAMALAEPAFDEPRPLSPFPIQLSDDEWRDWELTKDYSFYNSLHLRQLQYWYSEYRDQKTLLEAIHEKNDTDVFISSFEAVEKDGVLSSYCIWLNGIDSLLPRADRVALVRSKEDKSPLFVSWKTIESVVGSLMQPTEHYPPRFHVTEFPSDEQLRLLAGD